ncbi:hypothetical protein CAOG_03992 [Capsaspora owczarzaki ATCC 30864]|uniref:Fibronectin type-III domain-containing protein n=1 Tax=Capsaspora owczarzaki (strain ATCC 30864) TaxID=595528 RepID=A0A0D2X2U4_CAPO3|nr:hypothetical protein CAOG_03992 [Capsaspora owczarzaki ATCC 30864]KJE93164.1 hypothetical protein, variant [Capsaspora owczarzaki ATCC 30864]|eukprot:XP_004347817.2 hypothetical protein CAOG_03992 [Capsaspora owczarzaki ATCC 30864]
MAERSPHHRRRRRGNEGPFKPAAATPDATAHHHHHQYHQYHHGRRCGWAARARPSMMQRVDSISAAMVLLLLLFAAAALPRPALAVTCGSTTLASSLDVARFVTACTAISGSLTISGSDIISLQTPGLQSLVNVTGGVTITSNTALGSLAGLEALTNIGGSLSITSNPALGNLAGLAGVRQIGGSFEVSLNSALTSFSGLSQLRTVAGSLTVSSNPKLRQLNSTRSLTLVNGDLTLLSNPLLASIEFPSLVSIGANASVIACNPTSLQGLCALKSVGSNLAVRYNPVLADIDGLSKLRTVGGGMTIEQNAVLANVDGLLGLSSRGVGGLVIIQDNAALCFTGVVNWTSVATTLPVIWRNRTPCPASRAAPLSVPGPTYSDVRATSVLVSWEPASNVNGIVTAYRLFVGSVASMDFFAFNSSVLPGTQSFCANSRVSYNLTNLSPYKTYSMYTIASNLAGSTSSAITTIRTAEAAPQNVSAPVLIPISSRQIDIQFKDPAVPNGVVSGFVIRRNGAEIFNSAPPVPTGSPPRYTFSDRMLEPYTSYTYVVYAKTSAGSTASPNATVRTLEDVPASINPPVLQPYNRTSLNITWSAPDLPNGLLVRYTLDLYVGSSGASATIYSGTRRWFIANGLSTEITYLARVTFWNSAGSVTSAPGAGSPAARSNDSVLLRPTTLWLLAPLLCFSVLLAGC